MESMEHTIFGGFGERNWGSGTEKKRNSVRLDVFANLKRNSSLDPFCLNPLPKSYTESMKEPKQQSVRVTQVLLIAIVTHGRVGFTPTEPK